MRMFLFTVGLALCAPPVQAQTWSELQSVPGEPSVRVFEMAGKGWAFADGKLLLVKDDELTIGALLDWSMMTERTVYRAP